MKRACSDGTHPIEFCLADFVGKLAAIVPPREVVPPPPLLSRKERSRRRRRKLTRRPRGPGLGWAALLDRVFGHDLFRCKRCHGPMRLRAVVVNPPASTRILARAPAPP